MDRDHPQEKLKAQATALIRATVDYAARLGLEFHIGAELEYVALNQGDLKDNNWDLPLKTDAKMYTYANRPDARKFFEDSRRVVTHYSETKLCQHEIVFTHKPQDLEKSDPIALCRAIESERRALLTHAREHNHNLASVHFDPLFTLNEPIELSHLSDSPEEEIALLKTGANGLHINVSLTEPGKDAMEEPKEKHAFWHKSPKSGLLMCFMNEFLQHNLWLFAPDTSTLARLHHLETSNSDVSMDLLRVYTGIQHREASYNPTTSYYYFENRLPSANSCPYTMVALTQCALLHAMTELEKIAPENYKSTLNEKLDRRFSKAVPLPRTREELQEEFNAKGAAILRESISKFTSPELAENFIAAFEAFAALPEAEKHIIEPYKHRIGARAGRMPGR